MQIRIERLSEDKLTREVYRFNVFVHQGEGGVTARFDSYFKQRRYSRRHRTWMTDWQKRWERHTHRGMTAGARPEVPEDVSEEVLGILTGKITVDTD